MVTKFKSALLPLALLTAASSQLWAENLYRYSNHDGVMVIDDSIPPELVINGYDIISRTGELIERVPRQLTKEELLLRNTEEARARMKQEEEEKMRAWDESLLLRYSSIEDLEDARNRAVRELKIRISILKSNLLSVKGQIERQQGKAADLERQNQKVPQSLLDNIASLKVEIEDTEEAIQHRRNEITSVEAHYQRDIDRFRTLMARFGQRR